MDSIVTNSSGIDTFQFNFPVSIYAGQVITATATDPANNTSEFSAFIGGTERQIVEDFPWHYKINEDGEPTINDKTDFDAIKSAYQHWEDIPTSTASFVYNGPTTERYARSNDGINLVTFTDDRFPFSPGVLAVAAKTIEIDENGEYARIIDADIVFNPAISNDPKYSFATDGGDSVSFDIESISTHEIGHVLGLIHSGVEEVFCSAGP
jgi:hypothetical protein